MKHIFLSLSGIRTYITTPTYIILGKNHQITISHPDSLNFNEINIKCIEWGKRYGLNDFSYGYDNRRYKKKFIVLLLRFIR